MRRRKNTITLRFTPLLSYCNLSNSELNYLVYNELPRQLFGFLTIFSVYMAETNYEKWAAFKESQHIST